MPNNYKDDHGHWTTKENDGGECQHDGNGGSSGRKQLTSEKAKKSRAYIDYLADNDSNNSILEVYADAKGLGIDDVSLEDVLNDESFLEDFYGEEVEEGIADYDLDWNEEINLDGGEYIKDEGLLEKPTYLDDGENFYEFNEDFYDRDLEDVVADLYSETGGDVDEILDIIRKSGSDWGMSNSDLQGYVEAFDNKMQKEFDEYGLEESNFDANEPETKQALAKHLSLRAGDLQEGYRDNVFETEDGEEYFVGTEEEAYQEAKDQIMSIIDDQGLESFTPDFQDWILENAIDEDFLNDIIQEEIDYMQGEGEDTEYLESLVGDSSGIVQYLVDNFGSLEETGIDFSNNIDWDKVAEEAIRVDGIGHFVAGYDGEEIDLGNGLFAYRTN